MSGALNLTFIFLAAFFTCSHAQWPRSPLSPVDEATYMFLENTDDAIIASHGFAEKLSKTIVKIRKQFPEVAKIRNQGNWYLGRVLVPEFNDEINNKINNSRFGPVTGFRMPDLMKSTAAEVSVSQPYHPDRMSMALKEELGIEAKAVWYDEDVPDIGRIKYDSNTNEYSFTDGLFNCGPNCGWIRTWNFKVDGGEITLDSMSEVDVPKMRE